MNKIIKQDLYRFRGNTRKIDFLMLFFKSRAYRQLYYFRKYNLSSNFFVKWLWKIFFHFTAIRTSIEMPLTVKIDEGLLLLHPYNITLNSKTVIGKNCTLLKGCTIGATKDKNGNNLVPIIKDNVYIGINSTIVGGITIGNNSLIAANSFVNFDVPDDSIVVGNPGIIHYKQNASEKYINNNIKNRGRL